MYVTNKHDYQHIIAVKTCPNMLDILCAARKNLTDFMRLEASHWPGHGRLSSIRRTSFERTYTKSHETQNTLDGTSHIHCKRAWSTATCDLTRNPRPPKTFVLKNASRYQADSVPRSSCSMRACISRVSSHTSLPASEADELKAVLAWEVPNFSPSP